MSEQSSPTQQAMNLEIDGTQVLSKLQELYPTEFAHALAEVKCEMLAERLAMVQSERSLTEKEPG